MRNSVENRGVDYLVHFTCVDNLSSIFNNGLLSVSTLKEKAEPYIYNDKYRLDGCHDATSLSIKFPNYKMFYKCRKENPDMVWAVLGIKRDVLWEKDCAFCVENAASSNVSNIPIQLRKGINAFNSLYNDYPGKPTRNILGISNELPTHPQAEVLVFDAIQPNYIWGIAFENSRDRSNYEYLVPSSVKVEVQPHLFSYREDYLHW